MVITSPGTHFMYMWVKVTFTSWNNIKKSIKCHNRVPLLRQYFYQLFYQLFNKLFSNSKFLNSLRILCSILLPNFWKLMMYYFALFFYTSKFLKIDHCKLWSATSYVLTCPKSIFRVYKRCYFSIKTGFLTKEKAVIGSLRWKKTWS